MWDLGVTVGVIPQPAAPQRALGASPAAGITPRASAALEGMQQEGVPMGCPPPELPMNSA